MNQMNLYAYKEKKDRPVSLKVWRAINALCFGWCGNGLRQWLLRAFGAKIGKGCLICRGVTVYAPWNLEMGEMVCIGPKVELYCKDKIIVGSGVVISQDAYLCTASHDITSVTMDLITKPLVIGDNSWIAAKATILPGVTIGEGVVVGACAVIAKDVPDWSMVVGNPARVVKKRELSSEFGNL